MKKLIDISEWPVKDVLDILLANKTGISVKSKSFDKLIWATRKIESYASWYEPRVQLNIDEIESLNLGPRVLKGSNDKKSRTRKHAEVFTPAWLCNYMLNKCDEDWFGYSDVFNVMSEDLHSWVETDKIIFSNKKGKTWKDYVNLRRLEITCGEAPFLVSRYDALTGKVIPISKRIGVLDRKIRVINENTQDLPIDKWFHYVERAFESTYGYEYQGDNLLVGRINLLMTFVEYHQDRWGCDPSEVQLRKIANKISWNLIQMDGFSFNIPYSNIPCILQDWRSKMRVDFKTLKRINPESSRKVVNSEMLFDRIIGNPPYQEETENTSDKAIYNDFMDACYSLGEKVMLVTPARFLFNAGKTPKAWNEKMLNDEHFQVLKYSPNSKEVFPGTDIKGGVAIHYRDVAKDFGKIGTFTPFNELNSIMKKVTAFNYDSLSTIIYTPESYKFSQVLHNEHPEIKDKLSAGHMFDIVTNIFEKLPDIFTETKSEEDDVCFIGRTKQGREKRYIKRRYIQDHDNLENYKVILPKANGSGAIGEVLTTPLVGVPLVGHTQTFISIGSFESRVIADNCLKYIKTKFARTMLGILKITQLNNKPTWKYVPLQDFTENSDIDWSVSISEIDKQLYKKYGLSEEEIKFIEEKVKEME